MCLYVFTQMFMFFIGFKEGTVKGMYTVLNFFKVFCPPQPPPHPRPPAPHFSEKPKLPAWTPWLQIKNDVDFDVVFLSFCYRCKVPLGKHFRTFWHLLGTKLVPKPSSNCFIFETLNFHEAL